MIEFEAKVKKWGNSMGIILPKEKLDKEGISKNSKVKAVITPAKTLKVKDLWGMAKDWKKPTEQIMKEIDEELDSKYFKKYFGKK